MSESIFRKKNLDRIKSPENLDDYIRVANPGVWLLLISVIFILIGICIWGIFGRMESTVSTAVYVENGKAVCYVDEEHIIAVANGQCVRFADSEAVIISIGQREAAGYPCTLDIDPLPKEGFYTGQIVIRSYQPLSFVLN